MTERTIREVALGNLNGGAIQELFDVEWKKIVDSIGDLNTKPDAIREVSIKVKIKPDKTRRTAVSEIHVTSKLPSMQPHESFIFFERKNGEVVAYPDDPNQGTLEGIDEGLQQAAADGVTIFPKAR